MECCVAEQEGVKRLLRILILHQNMGSGHKRVARIVEDIIHSRMEAEIVNIAANDILRSHFMNCFEPFWNWVMRRNWVAFADFWGAFMTRALAMPVLEALNTTKLYRLLDLHAPDLIVSTVDGFNKTLAVYALSNAIPLHIYTTSYSIFLDNVQPAAKHFCYFDETASAIRSFDLESAYFQRFLAPEASLGEKLRYVASFWYEVLRGRAEFLYARDGEEAARRNSCQCIKVGPLVEAKHFAKRDTRAIKRRLGITNGLPCVLIASGSLGAEFILDAVYAMLAGPQIPLNLLVMCGKDRRILARARRLAAQTPIIRLFPFGYTRDFEDFLAVADCVAARPSAGIFNECLVHHKPYIAVAPCTSNDKGIFSLVQKHRLGEVCERVRLLSLSVRRVLENGAPYAENIRRFLEEHPSDFETMADVIAHEVILDLEGTRATGPV